ncbi:polysaccharide deacetylase family protein [Tissierella sp. Yu-01]|uniref:polysaccharide deacetylase family protein n=1 Tax=Tissierella sp. Yu-01 TaxID=3035694 RepID=UPI00240DD1BC|nr:polysaccharide deacetylase family protein [Tissierella sp. Yu-01]WFA09416.1 polysaccharide deacetylase [Tissierella sp. Yu-01]
MRNERRISNNKKKITILAIIILIFCAIIGGVSIKNIYFGKHVAEAVNVKETLDIMYVRSPVNQAINNVIKLHEKKLADIELNKQRNMIKEEQLEHKREAERIAEENGKIAYLTFDDGPSLVVTPQILDILDEYDIKATFFVLGNMAEKYPGMLKLTYERGHCIGNHTYSHNYGYLYKSPKNLINDLNKSREVLKKILGDNFDTNIARFPGGSFGKEKYTKAVKDAGYEYYDWNSLNGDAEGVKVSKERLISRFKETSENKDELIILMHDTDQKQTTVDALREIIDYLIEEGYVFRTLDVYNGK